MMRLYVIRHGETEWNLSRRLQGQTDIALNERGRALARTTALGLREVPFDLCFTSPLQRARETAELVLAGREIPIIPEARIAEISFGVCEGRCVKNEAGEITDPLFRLFFGHPESYLAPEGGESLDELCARTGAFLNSLAGRKSLLDKTILVSTHGAASRALLTNMKHSPRERFWDTGVPKNCAVTVAELAGGDGTADNPARWNVVRQDAVFY